MRSSTAPTTCSREDAPPAEIVARVRAARRAQEMQEQLLSREHDLEAMAYHDELTGVANRRYAVRQLHALLSRARRHDQELSVVLLDADRFKALNDRHGHGAGDDVLRGLAARLRSRVREEDIVARFGGEEFLIVLPDTGAEGAASAAEDLRASVAAQPFPVGRFALPLTVSVGWATWRGETLERLVARADRGLYAAKESGARLRAPGRLRGARRRRAERSRRRAQRVVTTSVCAAPGDVGDGDLEAAVRVALVGVHLAPVEPDLVDLRVGGQRRADPQRGPGRGPSTVVVNVRPLCCARTSTLPDRRGGCPSRRSARSTAAGHHLEPAAAEVRRTPSCWWTTGQAVP